MTYIIVGVSCFLAGAIAAALVIAGAVWVIGKLEREDEYDPD